MNKIILLDSNSLVNRAFYAMPPMNAKDGTPTNAVYGFMLMLLRLIAEHKPTHIAAVFDLPVPTFRHKMYDQYKGTRKPMPEELAAQMPILREVLAAMNIKILQLEGYEADDIIGTIAKRFDDETIIVSGDRDVLQLVDATTKVFNTKRGVTDIRVYGLEQLMEEGFTPGQIIEYKALAGDSSDNIPGAKGVGEKTATGLLAQYGNVDGIYEHIDEIKGKLKDKLIESKENVYLSRRLARINTDVPLACGLECMEFSGDFSAGFYDLLNRLDFKSLLSKFSHLEEEAAEGKEEDLAQPDIVIEEITSLDKLYGVILDAGKTVALDIGDTVSFAFDQGKQYTVAVGESLLDSGVSFDDAVLAFKDILSSKDIIKVLFDAKTVMRALQPYGITVAPPYEDLLLKSYLIDSTNIPKSLADIAKGEGRAAKAILINERLDKKLKELSLTALYRDIELPLIEVLFDMETAGFNIDTAVLSELSEKYSVEIKELESAIYEEAGETFNINSPKQLEKILFEKLSLKHGKKTKTGYSVAAEVLEELEHPIIRLILRYRQLVKLQSTYINGMRAVISPGGKVHTAFKQCLTATGRLSSTEPNLQNIPIRTEDGREIRKMFVPEKGNVLISADYSQIELRLLAHFSGDKVLIDAYRRNKDIHTITAAKIYGVSEDKVTKSMRRDAKAVNFGIIYGISAFGLSNNIGISPYQAKIFQEKYFETYPAVREYMSSNVASAHADGYIRTLMGRIRFFPEFKSNNHNIRSFGERAAMNMPLQGSASDIIKIAMLRVHRALKEGGYKSKLILQVHDELILDAPAEEAEEVKKLLINAMENAVSLKVPLTVEAKAGINWYEAE